MILGRNAYGAILVLDNANDPMEQRVRILDPFTVTYDGELPRELDGPMGPPPLVAVVSLYKAVGGGWRAEAVAPAPAPPP